MNEKLYMVFDVESVGLHGEGFAVGFVVVSVINQESSILHEEIFSCPWVAATGNSAGQAWVATNIPHLGTTHKTPQEVRSAFWTEWLRWKQADAILVADCAWPVEARFLNQCVDDAPAEREWQGAYPLIDLSSILLANGKDPVMKFPRKANELPEHNPLCDARQSARILVDHLRDDLTPLKVQVTQLLNAAACLYGDTGTNQFGGVVDSSRALLHREMELTMQLLNK